MSLFALVKTPNLQLMRVPLSQALADQIAELFQGQAETFLPEGIEPIAFDGRYRPEDDEIFEIPEFPDPAQIFSGIANPLDVPVFELNEDNVGRVGGLVYGDTKDNAPRVLLQAFDKRRAITPQRGFTIRRFHDEQTFERWQGVAVTLDSQITAVLYEDRLLFKSLFHVRRLFDMSAYYAEATDADLAEFERHEKLCVQDGFALKEIADSWIRSRVGLISQSGILDTVTPRRLRTVASRFDLRLQLRRLNGSEKIELPTTRKEMKRLLKFLDEDYYESPLTADKYVASSKRPLRQA